jgi:hypothetical protein
MSHSVLAADRRTHCKIVAVALASSVGLVMLSIAAWRADSASSAHAQTGGPLIAAGRAVSATAGAPIIR